MEQSLSDLENNYNNRLNELISTKHHNTQIFTKPAYLAMVESVKKAKAKKTSKLPKEYRIIKTYDVVFEGETEKLIVPAKEDNVVKYYVHTEEIFQILHETHIALGHCGRDRMIKELHVRYKNITREMIAIYLNLCEGCQRKQKVSKKDSAGKLVLINEINSRCQVDLIDMQAQPDEQYKFILVYQDFLTKFVQLRPLKTNLAVEVATVLLDIFTIFGAPSILQSDKERVFASDVIKELSKLWPELKMVHGKPKYLQSPEFFEKCDKDIEKMLSLWLKANNTNKWSEGISFVQLMKNQAYHSSINCSPSEAMFGTKLKIGLKNSIPSRVLVCIETEEDLENFLKGKDNDESPDCTDSGTSDAIHNNIIGNTSSSPSHCNIKEEVQSSSSLQWQFFM